MEACKVLFLKYSSSMHTPTSQLTLEQSLLPQRIKSVASPRSLSVQSSPRDSGKGEPHPVSFLVSGQSWALSFHHLWGWHERVLLKVAPNGKQVVFKRLRNAGNFLASRPPPWPLPSEAGAVAPTQLAPVLRSRVTGEGPTPGKPRGDRIQRRHRETGRRGWERRRGCCRGHRRRWG